MIDPIFSTGQGGSDLGIILTMLFDFFLAYVVPVLKPIGLAALTMLIIRKLDSRRLSKAKGIDEEL